MRFNKRSYKVERYIKSFKIMKNSPVNGKFDIGNIASKNEDQAQVLNKNKENKHYNNDTGTW